MSKDTIRRGLDPVSKTATNQTDPWRCFLAIQKEATIFDYEQRSTILNDVKKKQMAEQALEIMAEPSSIIFDSSTTVEAVIRELPDKRIHAVTNSLSHALLLANHPKTVISLLPGRLHKEQLFLFGTETVEQLKIIKQTTHYLAYLR